MTLIKSISGIRGTIGGCVGSNFTPVDIVKFTTAYGLWLRRQNPNKQDLKIVLGRDARISGKMVEGLVESTLMAMGIDILNLRLSTTPTVELAVEDFKADGGIIITASHNPKQWNALKLLNSHGVFLNAKEGGEILEFSQNEKLFRYKNVDSLGGVNYVDNAIERHIEKVLSLPLVVVDAIRESKFKIVVDAVNSTGGIAIPMLLERLGVEVVCMYCDPSGHFSHDPEPLKANLGDICQQVPFQNAHLGIAVDPDVDRLAIISEEGEMFGEEYTLVACADYVLGKTPGTAVSNLSSSRALRDVTVSYGQNYYASAVGEVNVVEMMKNHNAVIGGEGNGGVIYPELHYGRDALVGVALFLSLLAERRQGVSYLKENYPIYFMSKKKVEIEDLDATAVLGSIAGSYKNEKISTIDGVKIDFEDSWVHLRVSNTEPVIRIYTEAKTQRQADELADEFMDKVRML